MGLGSASPQLSACADTANAHVPIDYKITIVTFPRLDVDLHLAPFVDPRDHLGVAAARVTIGAPHFEKAREFWVRPVRWVNGGNGNLLLRPIESEDATLFLALVATEDLGNEENVSLPADWERGFVNGSRNGVKLPFDFLARYWRHPDFPIASRYILSDDEERNPPSLHVLNGSEDYDFKWPVAFTQALSFTSDEWINWPSHEFHAFVTGQFDDPKSQLRLTWQWLRIPASQRFDIYVQRPEWKGFMPLMKQVLQSEFLVDRTLWRARFGIRWYFLEEGGLRYIKKGMFGPAFARNLQKIRTFESSQRLSAWSQAVREHYESLATTMPAPHQMKNRILDGHTIDCKPPTHHEMLEARLQLHAWARAHLPPSRADELIALDDLN